MEKTEEHVFEFIKSFLDKFKGEEYRVEYEPIIRTNDRRIYRPDFLILRNGSPYIVIEVKRELAPYIIDRAIEQVKRYAQILYASYCIVCSEKEAIIFNTNDPNPWGKKIEVLNEELLQKLLENKQENVNVTSDDIRSSWKKYINNDIRTAEKLKAFVDSIKDENIQNDQQTFSLDENTEKKLFKTLLGEYNKDRLCRYTTLPSIFRTFNDKRHNMCCVVCMNDKSEIDYVAKYIDSKMLYPKAEKINGCYILSCCDIERTNDFTMLRLYADDAKGVCVEYRIEEWLKTHCDFILAPVSYATSSTIHPELDFVKNILEQEFRNKRLKFNLFHIWQHFFKPYEYKDEQEVRLLFFNEYENNESEDKGTNHTPPFSRIWIQDSSYNVICPIVSFKINDGDSVKNFPLKIETITMGPKAPEAIVNKEQLLCLLDAKGINTTEQKQVDVKLSNIKHYR